MFTFPVTRTQQAAHGAISTISQYFDARAGRASANQNGKLSITLDVPKRVFEQPQTNHPRSAYGWNSDIVDWWVCNYRDVSWEDLAAALESPEVCAPRSV